MYTARRVLASKLSYVLGSAFCSNTVFPAIRQSPGSCIHRLHRQHVRTQASGAGGRERHLSVMLQDENQNERRLMNFCRPDELARSIPSYSASPYLHTSLPLPPTYLLVASSCSAGIEPKSAGHQLRRRRPPHVHRLASGPLRPRSFGRCDVRHACRMQSPPTFVWLLVWLLWDVHKAGVHSSVHEQRSTLCFPSQLPTSRGRRTGSSRRR